MLFLDVAAAFPSMAHAFIMLVLEKIGISTNIVDAIRKFYANNCHYILFGCAAFNGFIVEAGIKQGCPLSGIISQLLQMS